MNSYEAMRKGKWAIDHYMEIGVLAAAAASLMYTFGYLVRALKFRG